MFSVSFSNNDIYLNYMLYSKIILQEFGNLDINYYKAFDLPLLKTTVKVKKIKWLVEKKMLSKVVKSLCFS